jgi:hypothetical protein
MREKKLAIAKRHVHLDDVDSERKRSLDPGERVLRRDARHAPVRDHDDATAIGTEPHGAVGR